MRLSWRPWDRNRLFSIIEPHTWNIFQWDYTQRIINGATPVLHVCKPCTAWAATLVMPSPNITGCLDILQWTSYRSHTDELLFIRWTSFSPWRKSPGSTETEGSSPNWHSTLGLKNLTPVVTLPNRIPRWQVRMPEVTQTTMTGCIMVILRPFWQILG